MSEWAINRSKGVFIKLAEVRLETIKKFEEYIAQNAKEVPVCIISKAIPVVVGSSDYVF